MKYQLIFQKAAEKFLKKQDRKTQERLLLAINQLPEGTDIKKLQGYNMFRMRVGKIRILYTVDDAVRIISIENIYNPGDAYKRFWEGYKRGGLYDCSCCNMYACRRSSGGVS